MRIVKLWKSAGNRTGTKVPHKACLFGAALGEPLYKPQANIKIDFIIDIFDIVQVALVFGWPG